MFRLIVLVGLLQKCDSLRTSKFHAETICDVQTRIDKRCSREVPGIYNLLKCLTLCSRQDTCIGASVDTDTNKCYVHETCIPSAPCNRVETKHKYYASHCVRGRWNDVKGSCDCLAGCHGDRCENVIQNCGELISHGYTSGTHMAYIDPGQDGSGFQVNCLTSNRGWWGIRVFMNGGLSGRSTFNRTWNEYVDGFYVDNEHYWMGLKKWHLLSSLYGIQKAIGFLVFANKSNVARPYKGFRVEDEEHDYSFDYDEVKGPIKNGHPPGSSEFGDCFQFFRNVPFSTWDSNTQGGSSCASKVGSGWWHPATCDAPCHLLGRGLDDWNHVPPEQRMAVQGVDMDTLVSQEMVERSGLHISP